VNTLVLAMKKYSEFLRKKHGARGLDKSSLSQCERN
jgi:hypothetical protein